MARKRLILLLPRLVITSFLIDSSSAIIAGLLASENFHRVSRSVVLIDNNPAYEHRKNLWNNTLNEYCTGSLISAYHVLTSGTCCNSDFFDQRVKVGSDHPRDRGYFLPVRNFTRIRFNPSDMWMSLCVIRLRIPSETEPLMRLPAEKQLSAHGTKLVWFGYGSDNRFRPELLERQRAGMPATTVDHERCKKDYFNLVGVSIADYCIETIDSPLRNVMSQHDGGGPLVNPNTNTVWGVGVTMYPYFQERQRKNPRLQLFAAVAPYRDEILNAMRLMDL